MSDELERLHALHHQLDGSMSTMAVMREGRISRTPAGETISKNALAWTIYSDPSVNVLMSRYDPGGLWPNHEHVGITEHLICVEGEFQVTIRLPEGDMRVVLSKGDSLRVPPGKIHTVMTPNGGKLMAICIPPELAY